MSEEILRALMQLFAIIAKQDEGVEADMIEYVHKFLKQQLTDEAVQEYMELFNSMAIMGISDDEADDTKKRSKLTSVKDSVRILGLCKKINKKLNQGQKVVALVRLFELVSSSRKFTDQRLAIINTVADVFKISKEEFKSIESFVVNSLPSEVDDPSVLIINDTKDIPERAKKIRSEELDGSLYILQIKSVELYFLKYTGSQDVFLNGLALNNKRIYLFSSSSTIKLPKGKPVYYSDVVSHFLADRTSTKLTYEVENISFRFPTGDLGIRNISFSEGHGKLIGIMGASGSGKTTLLNVLAGIEKPSEGKVLINGVDMHSTSNEVEGVIGYIPQDDLLIEELTVFENLYFCAKQCFKDKTEQEIVEQVNKTLSNLGLFERKDLKVGSPLNKMISGGQRKRLNIALELIREPSILFVDEPTSGLSSRDSENVMNLLSELSLKGKLIFVVIHQPSSDIYKMFDKMIILDAGGYMIFHGNPVEAIMYFKRIDVQINSEVGECPTCGNVTPEQIFNIIEAQVVDEFGKYTNQRKVSPPKWEQYYKENIVNEKPEQIKDKPPATLNIPSWFSQFKIYTLRDFLTKISNTQYIVINIVEAPLLAFILSFLIRYIVDPQSSTYIFFENENIPPYIFMCIIVSLFLGLTVSAEEIIRDRKILKREKFLNLSRSSYLVSKILILMAISALQSILYVLVGNYILEIQGMTFEYWYIMFATSVFANMMGLNISATFNSAVTIYILIPLLMIPQMALGGAMFSFDKLNRFIGSVGKVPIVADLMISRWAYEALIVNQFKNNEYEKNFYELEKLESVANFKKAIYLTELDNTINEIVYDQENKSSEGNLRIKDNLALLTNEFKKEAIQSGIDFEDLSLLTPQKFTEEAVELCKEHLKKTDSYYSKIYEKANTQKSNKQNWLDENRPGIRRAMRNAYHNEAVLETVKKAFEKNKIIRYKNSLVQQIDPIFLEPEHISSFGFRTHFFAPNKYLFGKRMDTFWFNSWVIWFFTFVFFITLYFEHLKKFLELFNKIKLKKKN
jgi:ABC transport system ATP-binding/permease protein